MWPDNDTNQDFLNFGGVASTVAEIVVQAKGRPISIGVSGAWGAGKSSMIKLTRAALEARTGVAKPFVFVEFNAWLYQGYDDARAALTEVIARTLLEQAQTRKSGVEKALDLLARVNWLRAAKLAAGSGMALSLGLPPVGLIGEAWQVGKELLGGRASGETIEKAGDVATRAGEATNSLIKAPAEHTPPKEIQALRASFEEALEEIGVTLVVLIDDLDRCLPETTISTLEAIRLFLFLKNTAFVVAADTDMIKHAVRRHFVGIDDDALVTNYFDKLIQVPIRVPALGTQEVRAYMMMLYIEISTLPDDDKENIRDAVCKQLGLSWQGKRVDRAFLQTVHDSLPSELISQFDTAERLAPLMASASAIGGNPRLVKRFLNALAIRLAIARAQGVALDDAALAKMLLFERLGNPRAHAALIASVSANEQGKPVMMAEWEADAAEGKALDLPAEWDDVFTREWLTLAPRLADIDLRGVLYVSREHAPLISPEDRLSSEAAELLTALLEHPDMAATLKPRLLKVPRQEMTVILDRLLDHARREQDWGAPPVLTACLIMGEVDPAQAARVAAFIRGRPPAQIKPNIVPKIGDQPWADAIFDEWARSVDISGPVKAAIKQRKL
jgi:predicted KAP-like P-loop ATPase